MEDRVRGVPTAEAMVQECMAVLLAMSGRVDDARVAVADLIRAISDLGLKTFLADYGSQIKAKVELSAGNEVGAIEALREGLEMCRTMGYEHHLLAGWLARQLAFRGEDEEALRLADVGASGDPLNVAAHSYWRQAKAVLFARSGNPRDARRLCGEALDLIPPDWYAERGDAWMTKARVERLLGDEKAAAAAVKQAISLFDRKGAVALSGLARDWEAAADAG
jgi:ATP/maltotriose-dependent transcriptional regulator MalT